MIHLVPNHRYEGYPKVPVHVCYSIRCFTFYHLDENTIQKWLQGHDRIAHQDCVVSYFNRKENVSTTIDHPMLVNMPQKKLEDVSYRRPGDDKYDYKGPVLALLNDVWARPLITEETKKFGGHLNVLSIQLRSARNLLTHPWKYVGPTVDELEFY